MIKVTDAVYEILSSSDEELELMRQGLLNLSAFADKIHPQVEAKTWKKVKRATIIVALSRLQKNLPQIPALRPTIHLDELSLKSPLADVTFEKNRRTLERSRSLSAFLVQHNPHFFTITQGMNEVTIIVSQEQLEITLEYFDSKPKALFKDLVGVTVKFSERYIQQPNVIYTILSLLAAKRVNIVEIVSTYTELTVVIDQGELNLAVETLNTLFRRK